MFNFNIKKHELKDYKLLNQDSFEYMKTLPDNSIPIIVSDPPYGISFEGHKWDTFDEENSFYDFIKEVLSNFKRILKDNGVIWMFCAPTMFDVVDKAIRDNGLKNHLEWWKSIQRQKGRGSKSRPKSQREDILLITKTDNFTFNDLSDIFKYDETVTNTLDVTIGEVARPEFNIHDSVFYFKMPYYLSKTEKMFHSCQKSILLLYSLIINFSKKDDTVFDAFAGSGSTGIAALLADRNFVGCELDKDMYEKALNWKNNFNFDNYRRTFLKDLKDE